MLEDSTPGLPKSPFDSRGAIVKSPPPTFAADAEVVVVRQIEGRGVSDGAELIRAATVGAFGGFYAGLTLDPGTLVLLGQAVLQGTGLITGSLEIHHDSRVQRFIDQHNLAEDVHRAIQLAGESFPGDAVTVELESDPEAGDEWLVVEVSIKGLEDDEVLTQFDRFTRAWITATRPEQRDLITLTYLIE